MSATGLFGSLAADSATALWLRDIVFEVEQELRTQTASPVTTVEDIGSHTLLAGGKRLRPALVAVSALASGGQADRSRLVRLGACLEMVHMATLIHDDVIDEAKTRRGVPTAASLHGNTSAILGGDVLLAKAMHLLALDGDIEVIRTVSEAVVDLAEGEVWELEVRGLPNLDEETHRRILDKKTGSLISCACRIGALAAGAPPETVAALGDYGSHLGLAFQFTDDLLDYCGDQQRTGKPWCADFREGQATLPLIRLWPKVTDEERARIDLHFGNGVTSDDLNAVVAALTRTGTLDEVRSVMASEAEAAVQSLGRLADSEAKSLLAHVTTVVIDRDH